jgi:two-component system, OmpR family, phosphate regulon sensor histidine kinase PhoR
VSQPRPALGQRRRARQTRAVPIDLRRLLDGVSTAAEMVNHGRAGLAAVEVLLGAAKDATGAAGATFTDIGGRVIAAVGEEPWAQGLLAPELLEPSRRSWIGPLAGLPGEATGPLREHGVVAVAAHPVEVAQRVLGVVHLYFDATGGEQWRDCASVLRAVAAVAGQAGDTAFPADEDDRTLFLAVAGHELRTPVTVLKGYAGMLAQRWESLDEEQRREAAQVLLHRSDELARLVDRMLSASVGDARWVRTTAFDFLDAVANAVGQLPTDLREAVHLDLSTHLPLAYGDPSLLSSILAELVTNAVRATAGAASVDVQAGADARTVYLRVCDRGVGVDPADVERAFERFWRRQRTDASPGGAGLGLYLVRRLVERQNGWVSLRPRNGGGSIAEVHLPRIDGPRSGASGGVDMTMAVSERAWSMVVPHHARGVRLARRRLAAELTNIIPLSMLTDAVAVVAELLGNALRHANPLPGGVIRLAWRVGPTDAGPYVVVKVTDGGAAQSPAPRDVGPDSVDGRGLAIVSALAQRWGVEPDGTGQCVWAELGMREA